MHSYQHNIKTFNNATMHLTHVERSLYRCLIELYYDTEQPLPADDFERLARRVMAHSEQEKASLRYILDEFFELTGDVYTHDYCDQVIEKYQQALTAKGRAGRASAEARRKKAEARKAKRKEAIKQNSTGDEQVLNSVGAERQQNPTKPGTKKPRNQIYIPFEQFWSVYPRKTDKARARAKWEKLKIEPDTFALITQNIRQRLAVGEWSDPKFIPHATTYLNGKRWEDEVIPPGGYPHETHQRNRRPSLAEESWRESEEILADIEARETRDGAVAEDAAIVRPQVGEPSGTGET